MPYLPPQGTPGILNQANPTLIPNFDRSVAGAGGTVDHQSPAAFLQNNPRVDALGTITVGGSITNGDTVTLTTTLPTLAGGSAAVTYPVVTADTTTTVAEGILDAINNSAALQAAGIFAEMSGTGAPTAVVVHANGPIGNMVTLSASVSGGNTETLTFSNGGTLAGGSGPVFATNNFNWGSGGEVLSFFYGQPYQLGYDVLTQMINQGMPIE
ncbi:MAG TPA: hypothetical protein VL614_14965 [Acetobacteraceae bacterium]|jgi:hypothetical protein|nr:hypothetical protein [Acetobacteraceae bacterium]